MYIFCHDVMRRRDARKTKSRGPRFVENAMLPRLTGSNCRLPLDARLRERRFQKGKQQKPNHIPSFILTNLIYIER